MFFGVRRSEVGRWQVLSVTGEIDLASLPRVRSELHRIVGGDTPVMVDLSDCDLIDSLGLGALVGAARRARQSGHPFCVVAPRHPVARTLRVSRVAEILDVVDSAADAVGS